MKACHQHVRFFAGFTSSSAFRSSVTFIVRLKNIPKYAPPCSVCRRSCNAPFGIVDVERPCPSTAYFEEIGQTRRCERNCSHENGTRIRGIKIQ